MYRPFSTLAWAVAAGIGLSACTLPATSRTAAIYDVNIDESLSNDNLLVQPGDEIRWVNLRKLEVRIDIPKLTAEDLSCQRGFRNWIGMLQESVELDTNQSASLCFKKPAVVNYNVRAETALPGGKKILPGVVKVGNPQNP